MRTRKPYGNGGGVRFLLLPPDPFAEKGKSLRIDVSYVSGLFAELRFYSCRWAAGSICTFCAACVPLEEFFRVVCSGNCTIFLFDMCMQSRFQKLYRSHFGSRYKLGCCGHASLMEMVGVFDSCCCRRTPLLKKIRPLGLMFLMFLGCLPSSDFTAADGPPLAHSAQHVFD